MASRPRNLKKDDTTSTLYQALKFISFAQKDVPNAAPNQTHCALVNGWAIAYDGAIALGIPIEEQLFAFPHTESMLNALAKCGQQFVITQLDGNRLSVKSGAGGFRATVQCVSPNDIPYSKPDENVYEITDDLKFGLDTIVKLCDDKQETIVEVAVLVRQNTMVSSDRQMMIEHWHGFNLPTMSLPKSAILALTKIQKKLVGFGYSGHTATFHFEDKSWLRTQLYVEPYPVGAVDQIFARHNSPLEIPPNFYEGVKAVAPFSEGGNNRTIFLAKNAIQSHENPNQGATFDVVGLPQGIRYKLKHLMLTEQFAKKADLVGNNQAGYFYGDRTRAAVMQVAMTSEERMRLYREQQAKLPAPTGQDEYDKDIPF